MRIQDIDNKLQDFETKKQVDQESRRNFASLSSTFVKNATVTEASLIEANDYISNLKLNLNQESSVNVSVDPFGSMDHSAHKTSKAIFNH